MSKEILLVVESVSNEKGVEKDVIFEAIELALATAAKKRFEDEEADIRVSIDRKTGEYETFRRWLVVDNDAVPALGTELTLQEAEEIDPALKPGDIHEEKIESEAFGRIGAQAAKQIIFQKVREAERTKIVDSYRDRVGELVSGTVKKVTRDNVIVDPSSVAPVGKETRLIIPKINVDVPIVLGLESLDNATTQVALEDGVVHYPIPGANSMPGQTGNNVILGHSSNDVLAPGDYKFAFVLLERLVAGDIFYIHYDEQRFVYRITEKEVIQPNEVAKLVTPNDKPMTTLVTCTPIGTDDQRLLVFAEQISPDPADAEQIDAGSGNERDVDLPGNEPGFFQRLFSS